MNFTVVWAREAEAELADICMNVADRGMIAELANMLDRELANDPNVVGESRQNQQRITYCLPLGIQFQVFEADRLVRVLAVWLCRPR